jgi:hypothetical protein
MHRCIYVAPAATGITVAFVDRRDGTDQCLKVMGKFRLLEPVACAVDDPAQRFFFDEAARAFVSKSDPTQCVKYLADAGGFASWQCGSAPSFMAFDRREGKGHDRTAHAEYCVTLPGQGGGTACLKLATE